MNQETLLKRRDRTHAIVEGALLGDIAIVFLLMRAYLPILVLRPLIAAVATVPFVMLTQRRGLKMAVLAVLASYILFSALVGPLLGFAALNIGLAGILIGLGRRAGLGPALNTLWTGPVFAVVDLIIPTIVSVIVFRYPVHELVQSARNGMKLPFRLAIYVMQRLHASPSAVHEMTSWEQAVVNHWQIAWVAVMVFIGLLTMYLAVLVAEMVLNQIPEQTLSRQRAA